MRLAKEKTKKNELEAQSYGTTALGRCRGSCQVKTAKRESLGIYAGVQLHGPQILRLLQP